MKLNFGEKFLTIKEASKYLGVNQDTLRNWEKKGLLHPIRIGIRKDRRYYPEDLQRMIKEKKV